MQEGDSADNLGVERKKRRNVLNGTAMIGSKSSLFEIFGGTDDRRKVTIVGIGNVLKGDDGAGPVLVQKLTSQLSCVCIDAGTTPENFLGMIVREKPDVLLLIDAMHLGREPGAYEMAAAEEILDCGLTTHNISLRILAEFIRSEIDVRIVVLGIQPLTIAFGASLSEQVARTVHQLEDMILMAVKHRKME